MPQPYSNPSASPAASAVSVSGRRPAVRVRVPGMLETARLRLRPLLPGDRADFIDMLRESRLALDEHLPMHEPGDDDTAVFERHAALARAAAACPDVAVRRVIEHDGRLVGVLNVNDIQPGPVPSAEVVGWIRSGAAGHGFGAEAIRAIADDALAPRPAGRGVSILYALIAPANHAAAKAFARAGFDEVPGVPMIHLNVGGVWRPHMLFIRDAATSAPGIPSSTAGSPPAPREAAKIVVRRLMSAALNAP